MTTDFILEGMMWPQALDGGCAESAGMGPTFNELTGHLSAAHAQFLAHWLRLVDLEEGDTSAKRSEIWAMAGVTHS